MSAEFNTRKHIENWLRNLKSEPALTEADSEEMKSHLVDLMKELKEIGLDDEEAFWVATKRIGTISDWGDEFLKQNTHIVQIRRSVIVLAGVLAYFFYYHFVGFSSKLFFIVLYEMTGNAYSSLKWLTRYLIFSHLLIIMIFASLFICEKRIISFIENIRIKPRQTILVLIITLIFGIINVSLMALAKSVIGENYVLRSLFIKHYIYFDYSLPFLICLVFILIYFKYYKRAKF